MHHHIFGDGGVGQKRGDEEEGKPFRGAKRARPGYHLMTTCLTECLTFYFNAGMVNLLN